MRNRSNEPLLLYHLPPLRYGENKTIDRHDPDLGIILCRANEEEQHHSTENATQHTTTPTRGEAMKTKRNISVTEEQSQATPNQIRLAEYCSLDPKAQKVAQVATLLLILHFRREPCSQRRVVTLSQYYCRTTLSWFTYLFLLVGIGTVSISFVRWCRGHPLGG